MNFDKIFVSILLFAGFFISEVNAKQPDIPDTNKSQNKEVTGWRAVCVRPTEQITMEVNNVRARLKTGGDIWNISRDLGGYIVPKPASGQLPVSAIYAGGVWIGGRDRAGNIKLSGVTYRDSGADFFAGPLDINGTTDKIVCDSWDRFFTVSGINVRNHYNKVIKFKETGVQIDCDFIPDDVKYWPGQGNPYWKEKFPEIILPDQPLGAFWDDDQDNIYDPCNGDFPLIEIRGCEPDDIDEAKELIPDQMIFWIYNDNGGSQTLSGPSTIQMEVQVQSFAYSTNDEVNDMTFYRYKLINKANEDLVDCYFSMWIDPDLGCAFDDFIGCDISRSLAIVYNQDAVDGENGSSCNGTNTYGSEIPIIGMDYFRGPLGPKVFKRDAMGIPVLDADGNKILEEPEPFTGQQDSLVELGMTSFTYYENTGFGSFPPPTVDPQSGREEGFYNYIRGLWRDGSPLTFGGSGYNPGSSDTIRYAFPDEPNKPTGWSMCTANLPFGDRRTLQATGPLLLQPGATNELILGVVFVPDVDHPCPDITRLKFADDIAQALFDNCFDITDGPDAPDITPVELDQELIILFSNDTTSNNFNESYVELDLQAPRDVDSTYKFEGYRLYQLVNASVTAQELGDISKSRPIAQVDVKNGIREIYNWTGQVNPLDPLTGPIVWTPTREVTGENRGIRNSFRVTEDQFALTNRRLVNHKQYHFLVLAYAYNNWKPFDIISGTGQRRAYLEGRGNVGGPEKRAYTLVPRPIVYETLQSSYGEGPTITRISGEGNPGKFLEMDDTMYELILKKEHGGKILYKSGAGPIDAKIVDPLKIKDGKYRLEISGAFNYARANCAYDNKTVWKLTDVTNNKVVLQDRSLSFVKEYILNNLGFSITVGNEEDPGTTRTGTNGGIGARIEYKDAAGSKWFNAVKDGGVFQVNADGNVSARELDFVRNGFVQDPAAALSKLGDGFFVPFLSTRFEADPDLPFYLSPAARDFMALMTNVTNNSIRYRDLNNVDIVFTSDKSKWSKCIVVETTSPDFINNGAPTIDNTKNFEVRRTPSIDQNGKALNDGTFGFSYFPGYVIDVETGKRLNIFFGESSIYSGDLTPQLDGQNPIGGDLIFNPSSQTETADGIPVWGAQHYIYVTRQEYDECKTLEVKLRKGASLPNRAKGGPAVTWVSFPLGVASAPLQSIDKGLIPNDMTVKLRVNNPYGESRKYNIERERDCETDGDSPVYEFEFKNKQSIPLATQEDYVGALSNVNVVPNPYYAYSAYETSQFTNIIKITNLPAKATVTIYNMEGSFIRQYNRDERGSILSGTNRPTSTTQVYPDLEWDMKNFKDVPVASGVYLIHISAPEYKEERTIKWFGISRKFDPSGL